MISFTIYYGDGSVYRGDPFKAPPSNVQVVVTGTKMQFSKDGYYWKPEMGWCGCDVPGLYDYLQQWVGPKAVLFGRSIRDEDFWNIVKKARKDIEERKELEMG